MLAKCFRAFDTIRPIYRILLFGSHARGDHGALSDIDLCIVAERVQRQLEAARDFRRTIREIRPKPAFTLVPITPERLEEKKNCGDHFFGTVLKEGICLAEKD